MEKVLQFAPMQGYADHLYRRFHATVYGAADTYYTPFIRIEKGEARKQDISRLKASIDDGTDLVPQIIFNSLEEFNTLRNAIKELGFRHIDLNLGCPYPMQTRKGRGAAIIGNIPLMEQIACMISNDKDTEYSVKMRLGLEKVDEWKSLMPVLNSIKLAHITVHPRIATQMYGGEIFDTEFSQFIDMSKNPVIWNGDILSVDDIKDKIKQYPHIKGLMIGRGMLARPSLIAEYKDGKEWDSHKQYERLMTFHSMLFDAYQETLCGQAQVLQKIKPFWEYLEPTIGRKAYKAIHKATSIDKYRIAVESIDF